MSLLSFCQVCLCNSAHLVQPWAFSLFYMLGSLVLRQGEVGWEVDWQLKAVNCSSRRPEFHSQYPCQGAHSHLNLQFRVDMTLLASRHLYSYKYTGARTHSHTHPRTHACTHPPMYACMYHGERVFGGSIYFRF